MRIYNVFFSTAISLTLAASSNIHDPSWKLFSRDMRIGKDDATMHRRDLDDSSSGLQRRGQKQKAKNAARRQQPQAQAQAQAQTAPPPPRQQVADTSMQNLWTFPPGTFPSLVSPASDASNRGASSSAATRGPPRESPRAPSEMLPGPSRDRRPPRGSPRTPSEILGAPSRDQGASSSAGSRPSPRESPRTPGEMLVGPSGDRRPTRTTTRERSRRETPSVTSRLSRLRESPDSGAVLASSNSHTTSPGLPELQFEKLDLNSPVASSSGSTGRPPTKASPRREMTSRKAPSPRRNSPDLPPPPPPPPDSHSATTSPTGLASLPNRASSSYAADGAVEFHNRPTAIQAYRPNFAPWFQGRKDQIEQDHRDAAMHVEKQGKRTRARPESAQGIGRAEIKDAAKKRYQEQTMRHVADYDYYIAKDTLANNRPGLSLGDAAYRRVTLSASEAVAAGRRHAQAQSAAAGVLRSNQQFCEAAKHAEAGARATSRCIVRNGVTKSFQDRYMATIGSNIAKVIPKENAEGRAVAFQEAVYLRKNYENSVREYRDRYSMYRQVRDEWPGSSSDESEKSFSDVKKPK